MASQTAAAAGPQLPDRQVTESEARSLPGLRMLVLGIVRTAGRGGACRGGKSPESWRCRGAGCALRPDLYRQLPRRWRA